VRKRGADVGWRRLIGSPKLQIIFHKRATKYRALLRKMTYTDKGSYESSPLCIFSLVREKISALHVWDNRKKKGSKRKKEKRKTSLSEKEM